MKKRKLIDIEEKTFVKLGILAVKSGKSLKRFIEDKLEDISNNKK